MRRIGRKALALPDEMDDGSQLLRAYYATVGDISGHLRWNFADVDDYLFIFHFLLKFQTIVSSLISGHRDARLSEGTNEPRQHDLSKKHVEGSKL
jgi:hypothetical protein